MTTTITQPQSNSNEPRMVEWMATVVTNVCTMQYKAGERVEIAGLCIMFQRMTVAPSISMTLLSTSGPNP
jgi:hypothetical protein